MISNKAIKNRKIEHSSEKKKNMEESLSKLIPKTMKFRRNTS
jgi:hypothetical protein